MLEESNNLVGLDIYGPNGIFIGRVDAIAFDTDARRIGGLMVRSVNPSIAEKGVVVSIPYSWVSAVGDIILLKRFPSKIFRDGRLEGL